MKKTYRIHNVLNAVSFRSRYFGMNCTNTSSYSTSYINNDDDMHQHKGATYLWVNFLESHGLKHLHHYKFRTYHTKNKEVIQLRECPLCPPHKNESTNLWTLGIFTFNGGWNCFRCGNNGNMSSLIKIFNIHGTRGGDGFNDGYYDVIDNEYIEDEESEICCVSRNEEISEETIKIENELLLKEEPLLNRLCFERNLSLKCFRDYQCGLKYTYFDNVQQKQQCITFPMYQYKDNRFVATKYKMRCVSNNIKRFIQYPVLNESGLFGFNNNNNKKVVITEGEYDSMAIYYGTEYKVKALSLPNGANTAIKKQIIQQLLHFYDDFVLFLDWDDTGQQNAHLFKETIHNFDENKAVNVEIVHKNDKLQNVKDANDILIKYKDDGKERIKELMHKYNVM